MPSKTSPKTKASRLKTSSNAKLRTTGATSTAVQRSTDSRLKAFHAAAKQRNKLSFTVGARPSASDAWQAQQNNAREYIRQVYNPHLDLGARLPSPITLGTVTSHLTETIDVQIGCYTGQNDYGGVIIAPNLTDCYNTVKTSTDGKTLAVLEFNGAQDSTHASALGDSSILYRVVSFGAHILDWGAQAAHGMVLVAGMMPITDSNYYSTGSYTTLMASNCYTEFDTNKLPAEGINMLWLPMTTDPVVERADASMSVMPTASGFRTIDEDSITDNRLYIFFRGTGETATDTVRIKLFWNLERIPDVEQAQFFNLQAAPGSPAAIAVAEQEANVFLDKHGWLDSAQKGLMTWASKAWPAVKPLLLESIGTLGASMLSATAKRRLQENKVPHTQDDLQEVWKLHRKLRILGLSHLSPLAKHSVFYRYKLSLNSPLHEFISAAGDTWTPV
jgi:hypothetical protein